MDFKRNFLFNVGITLGVVIIASGVIWFTAGKIQATVNEIHRVRTDEALSTTLLTYLGTLKANQERVRPHLSTVQNLLPTNSGAIALSETLRSLASRHNLESFSFSFGAERAATTNDPGTIAFTMNVTGTLSNLLTFMQATEFLSAYVLRVNTFDLVFRDRTSDYTLSLTGVVYIR